MGNYPYILKTGSIKKFLEKIPTVGIPDKITLRFLYALDFKTKNDRPLIPLLKVLKFLDDSGTPTERYKLYRDRSKSSQILGASIREAYSELFKVYPDAQNRDSQSLQNFFSTHTGLGERAIKSTVETFKTLSSMADFEGTIDQFAITKEASEINSCTVQNKDSLHSIDLALSEGRKAKIVLPQDVSKEEIDRLKKLLDALK